MGWRALSLLMVGERSGSSVVLEPLTSDEDGGCWVKEWKFDFCMIDSQLTQLFHKWTNVERNISDFYIEYSLMRDCNESISTMIED